MSLGQKQKNVVVIHSNNQSTIVFIENPNFHLRNKNIDIQVHFIIHQMQAKGMKLEYCSTQDIVIDIFTKVFPKGKHEHCIKLMGITSTLSLIWMIVIFNTSSTLFHPL